MTSLYSSKAQPKRVFGEGEMLTAFYETMAEVVPGAWALNEVLQQLWRPYALSHDWVLPDNFHVHKPVETTVTRFVRHQDAPVAIELSVNQGSKFGQSISPDGVHSIDALIVREVVRRSDYDVKQIEDLGEILTFETFATGDRVRRGRPRDIAVMRLWELYQQSGFLSARILEHLDHLNMALVDYSVVRKLVRSMPAKPFKVITVHDAFRVHPNYGNDLRRQYNQVLSEIAGSNMLAFIAGQILGEPVQVVKTQDIAAQVLEADYALT